MLDAARAATFTQSYSTCLFALRDRAHGARGRAVLVLGAGGGIGLAAIGVARALGCRVLGVASSEEKRAAALAAGAEAALDPAAESRQGRGAGVGRRHRGRHRGRSRRGRAAEPSLRALGDGGRYLVIGFASGSIPSIPLNQVLLRNRRCSGSTGASGPCGIAVEQRRLLDDLLAMVSAEAVRPVEPVTYGLDDVARALTDLLERRAVGKVALVP